jgi:putative endopeptidase
MLSSRLTTRIASLLAAIAPGIAIAQGTAKPLDRANLDTTCAPCTDFYQFANGSWLGKHTIPPDKTGLGSFGMLSDKNQEVVQKIVIDDASLARSGETKPGTNEWKIGTF